MRWLQAQGLQVTGVDRSPEAIAACTGLGELICAESLTYPGLKAIASQLGVQLHALTLDDEGPSAAEFEQACRTLRPKALYLNPTLQNPTTLTVSRRSPSLTTTTRP